jgi:hypothetical protein
VSDREFARNLYASGLSRLKVAEALGIPKHQVTAHTKDLTRHKKFQEVVIFNGRRYTKNNEGYWRRTDHRAGTIYLHRDTWEFFNGEIPKYHEIHHIDFNKDNNDPSNLECLWFWAHAIKHSEHDKPKEE